MYDHFISCYGTIVSLDVSDCPSGSHGNLSAMPGMINMPAISPSRQLLGGREEIMCQALDIQGLQLLPQRDNDLPSLEVWNEDFEV